MGKAVIASVVLLVISLAGCATNKTELALDQKLSQAAPVEHRSDLIREFSLLIQDTSGLTEKERSDLAELRDHTSLQAEDLREKSLRLRALLIKELLTDRYSPARISQIKTDIRDVEHDRLSLMFEAVHQVNRILGRQSSRHEREADEFDHALMHQLLDLYPPL